MTVYKRAERNWAYSLYAGKDPTTGKPKRVFKSGFTTKREAAAAASQAQAELTEQRKLDQSPRTLGALVSVWLTDHAERHCSPKTVERYRQLSAYLDAELCARDIRDIDPLILEKEWSRLLDSGGHHRRTKKPRPLSARTVRAFASIVHSALTAAVRWRYLRFNPADACQLPKMQQSEARGLDGHQTRQYLDAALGHWMYSILIFASATGCRRGEMLALRCSDLDLAAAVAHISRSLEQTQAGLRIKPTKNGRPRDLPLPVTLLEALNEHRVAQEANRKLFGADYQSELDLVSPGPDGGYLKPDTVTATACLLAQQAGLKGVGLHTLRHSHGSQLLSKGVSLPTVSRRLGHSSTHVTAKVYAHSFAADEVAAAQTWDLSIGSTLVQKNARQ